MHEGAEERRVKKEQDEDADCKTKMQAIEIAKEKLLGQAREACKRLPATSYAALDDHLKEVCKCRLRSPCSSAYVATFAWLLILRS